MTCFGASYVSHFTQGVNFPRSCIFEPPPHSPYESLTHYRIVISQVLPERTRRYNIPNIVSHVFFYSIHIFSKSLFCQCRRTSRHRSISLGYLAFFTLLEKLCLKEIVYVYFCNYHSFLSHPLNTLGINMSV